MRDDDFEYRIEFELPDGYRVATQFVGLYEVAANLASDIRRSAKDGTLKVYVTSRKKVETHGEA